MRFDGGSEYKKKNYAGIIKQVNAPYIQYQNGVSERFNRSLITIARCMLLYARLPLRFWDAAVITARDLRNRLPILRSKITLLEAIYSYAPEISHLKV